MLIYVGMKVAIYQISIKPALPGYVHFSAMVATFIARRIIHRLHFIVYIYNSLYNNSWQLFSKIY